MKRIAIILAALLAGACGGGPKLPAPAQYDFGVSAPAPAKGAAEASLPLRAVEVAGPSWLGTPAMQYRLAYADAGRRQSYVESRWAAPPAELLELALRRRMAAGGEPSAEGCRLRVELDEFVQVFDSPAASRAQIDLRAVLHGPRERVLARRGLSLSTPAATADARGGVAAFAALSAQATDKLAAWIGELTAGPEGLAARCRGQ